MPFRLAFSMIALAGLVACSQTPVLNGTLSATAQSTPYPALAPLGAILAGAPASPRITPDLTADIETRLASLRRRAAQLSGPVVDGQTRARMRGAISRAALR